MKFDDVLIAIPTIWVIVPSIITVIALYFTSKAYFHNKNVTSIKFLFQDIFPIARDLKIKSIQSEDYHTMDNMLNVIDILENVAQVIDYDIIKKEHALLFFKHYLEDIRKDESLMKIISENKNLKYLKKWLKTFDD